MTRLYIWSVILERDEKDVWCYQPEDDGYEIYSIYKSKLRALTCAYLYCNEVLRTCLGTFVNVVVYINL